MNDVTKSLTLLVLALIPGAVAAWAYEIEAGEWGIKRPDRTLRFIATSAVLQAIVVPLTFLVWRTYVRDHQWVHGAHLPWLLWAAAALYVVAPAVFGYTLGRFMSPRPRVVRPVDARRLRLLRLLVHVRANLGVARFAHRRRRRRVRALVARMTRARPPRAWDYFFAKRPDGWVRLKLRDGPWIGGIYAEGSYASGYPHEPQDIFLAVVVDVDPDTGEFVRARDGTLSTRDSAILVRWDQISYLEFIDG